jgi:hypothetical protein
MKLRLPLMILWIATISIVAAFVVQPSDPWLAVGDGISYQEFHLPEPNDIYVARMDQANANAILDSGIAQGRISYGTEKVSEMARRYDDSLSFWGSAWGARNQVVVAINGSYFSWTGAPESGQISSGWYAKRFTELGGSSGFGYRLNRTYFIGQCVSNPADRQLVEIYRGGQVIVTWQITGVNVPRGNNQLILYTPQYDDFTHTDASGLEVLVEVSRPTLIIPVPSFVIGTVDQILDHQGKTLIPFDHVVLSASGTVREQLLANLQPGDVLHISQEITSYDKDCVNPYLETWTKTYASVAGGFNNLRDGQIIPTTEAGGLTKQPRTAIAFNGQFIFFIVVDGRNPQRSVGMTYDELAAFARDSLGATWAITQDGGGSSDMVVNGQVKNHPVSLCDAVYLPVIMNNHTSSQAQVEPAPLSPTPASPELSALAATLYTCERRVANTMMMINVQPAERSLAFAPSDPVSLQSTSEIRLGPGTNYAAFASLPAGTPGVVLSHSANLNGIRAKGTSWWKVAFGSIQGWVDERTLLPAPTP